MGYGEMLMVLLAVVLFSTVMVGYYNNLFRWYTIHNREYYRLQALKLAESTFQEIEYRYISGQLDFADIYVNFQNTTSTRTISDVDYLINLESSWCDSSGQDSGSPGMFMRLDLSIACVPVTNDTVWIGTRANPLQKLIANMGL